MKILIATDGTEFSHSAIEKASKIIADPENTQIKIVSVFKEVLPLDISSQSLEYAENLEKSDQHKAEEFVIEGSAILKKNFPDTDIEITTEILKGAVDEAIMETAKAWQADIIVIGSHGRKFWERHLVGSICDALVHHAPCAVFVVRPVD
jgi:nucleotide-binding universal stress UspA family protein